MPETAQITLVVEQDVADRLAELAGGEARIAEYVTNLVSLHAQRASEGEVANLEQAIEEINELVQNEKIYRRTIYVLEQQLRRVLTAQQRVLATAHYESWQPMWGVKTILQ